MGENHRSEQLREEQARERRTDLWAWFTVVLITCGFLFVDVISEMTDGAFAGQPGRWHLLLLMDGSSVVILFLLFPSILWLTRQFPLTMSTWRSMVPLYLGFSLVWSVLHIAGMVALRTVLYPAFYGDPYEFGRAGGVLLEMLYEYRKDLWTFIIYLAVLYTFRHVVQLRRELETATAEAGRSHRLTLKCGGTTLYLDAGAIDWVRAAGNYVEISTGGKVHLARITLSGLQDQLTATGADIVRTHRSWLVNRERINELRPTGDGDQSAVLVSGDIVPVSRRYRDSLAQAA